MSRADKLIERACRHPGSLTFGELVRLAGLFGFHQVRQRGSHRIFKRPGHPYFNFQESGGMAKIAQVRQLLDYAHAQGWLDDR
ncbi:MAG: type II toxin-antitoxin system HicA family toxin [bacterium]|nr:type II toxin-antitoxin system HicA family toxin [bacterium]